MTKHIWQERFEDINAYERYLTRNGVIVRKFFLNVSRKEQKKRFLQRLDQPEKNWKFSAADVQEREHWDEYMEAYEEMIRNTATPHAPWYVVPADHKWVTRLIVAAAAVDTLQGLKLHYPEVDEAKREGLEAARAALESEDGHADPADGRAGGKGGAGAVRRLTPQASAILVLVEVVELLDVLVVEALEIVVLVLVLVVILLVVVIVVEREPVFLELVIVELPPHLGLRTTSRWPT